jgi:hypothetical protein
MAEEDVSGTNRVAVLFERERMIGDGGGMDEEEEVAVRRKSSSGGLSMSTVMDREGERGGCVRGDAGVRLAEGVLRRVDGRLRGEDGGLSGGGG